MADFRDIFRDEEVQGEDATPGSAHAAGDVASTRQVEAFERDARDGLQSFSDKKEIGVFVHQLNKNLERQINDSKGRRDRHKIDNQNLVLLTTIIILFVCVLFFIAIKFQRKKELPGTQPPHTTTSAKPAGNHF